MSSTTPFGPETDPGLLRGMGEGTPLAQLRIVGMAMTAGAVLILVIGAVVMAEPGLGPLSMVAIVNFTLSIGAVAVAALLPVPALPADIPPEEAARRSRTLFQPRMFMRLALCEVAAIFGLLMATIDPESGYTPLLAGALISGLALPLVALPTRGVIERFRAALEAKGARSHLWEGLRGGA